MEDSIRESDNRMLISGVPRKIENALYDPDFLAQISLSSASDQHRAPPNTPIRFRNVFQQIDIAPSSEELFLR